MKMEENKNIQELSLDSMEQVNGGVYRTVNTGVEGLNAAVRKGPAKGTGQIASLENGTVVDTISDKLEYDPVSGRNFVQVQFTDKNGRSGVGWIAASLVGMKR